jgi:hypothetical protein
LRPQLAALAARRTLELLLHGLREVRVLDDTVERRLARELRVEAIEVTERL